MKITEVKKKNGATVYRASVYLGVDQVTGKKVKTKVTGRTKTEVKQKAQQEKIAFQQDGFTRFQATSIASYQELAELWLDNYKLTVKPQSFEVTKRQLYNHVIPYFGNMKLEKIKPTTAQAFVNGLVPNLVNFKVIHSINSRILQYGVLLQVLPFNPARDVILPKKQKKGREAVKFIEPEHLKQFLGYAEELASRNYAKYYQYVIFKLLLATGCRIGELSALEWSDIDLGAGTISISKTYSMELHIIGTTKTKAGTRIISIDKKTALLLKQYRNRQRLMFLEVGACAPSVVFATTVREYLPRISLQEIINRRCKALGIPRFTCHAFRHTHASLLLNAGISYKELQYRLGHSNISMTLDTYGHLSKDKEKEAVSYYEKAMNSL
ncbi:TPA: tyrosine-type recombinase/integrase [Streptococcus suis]|uniref:tyrosine-type recombinase/integrase n=2 Tax=Streptococcus suis TaxID=1307 RepID=UPI0009D499E7|nr:site-specific integrase [Streptococcus suis]MBO4137729.1 site-specific integrase [Streptococcus suis]MBS8099366.1 site-specific integrase [Streptococcus suis]MBS8107958.1 site-specific integrase [Streptococcus suis]MBS8116811.1 site-specific integrase [Streptococcus suis]MCK3968691.1 site-specific integrase [Streptococcus suis]